MNNICATSRKEIVKIKISFVASEMVVFLLQLSSAVVNENSDVNVLVGTLTSLDQDTSQSHKYQLLDSASGRFKVDGNELKVRLRL